MFAFKFLGIGTVGLFSAFRWPAPTDDTPGAWVGADGEVEACRRGVHACRYGPGMLDWIDDELWVVELDRPADLGDDVVLGVRGRLVRRVEAWDAGAAQAFGAACEERARALASPAFAEDAAALLAGSRPETGATPPVLGPPTPGARAANLGFVVAHAVAVAEVERRGGEPDYAERVAAERRWQLDWLSRRLALADFGV